MLRLLQEVQRLEALSYEAQDFIRGSQNLSLDEWQRVITEPKDHTEAAVASVLAQYCDLAASDDELEEMAKYFHSLWCCDKNKANVMDGMLHRASLLSRPGYDWRDSLDFWSTRCKDCSRNQFLTGLEPPDVALLMNQALNDQLDVDDMTILDALYLALKDCTSQQQQEQAIDAILRYAISGWSPGSIGSNRLSETLIVHGPLEIASRFVHIKNPMLLDTMMLDECKLKKSFMCTQGGYKFVSCDSEDSENSACEIDHRASYSQLLGIAKFRLRKGRHLFGKGQRSRRYTTYRSIMPILDLLFGVPPAHRPISV